MQPPLLPCAAGRGGVQAAGNPTESLQRVTQTPASFHGVGGQERTVLPASMGNVHLRAMSFSGQHPLLQSVCSFSAPCSKASFGISRGARNVHRLFLTFIPSAERFHRNLFSHSPFSSQQASGLGCWHQSRLQTNSSLSKPGNQVRHPLGTQPAPGHPGRAPSSATHRVGPGHVPTGNLSSSVPPSPLAPIELSPTPLF